MRMDLPQLDWIGYWSEIKLAILKEYAAAYSRILAAQKTPRLSHIYVDAFSGAGEHRAKLTGEFVAGSPLNALLVRPPFREYHLIDLVPEKIENLRELVGDRDDIRFHEGDCNKLLLSEVFPKVRYEDYRRGLCVLDPIWVAFGLESDTHGRSDEDF
jgi:three-Cys-motif partner protein